LPVFDLSVSLVNVQACNAAGSRVHIFVSAPGGEVNIPVVELKKYIPSRMCKIPSNKNTLRLSISSDSLDVEKLSSVILDTGKEDNCRSLGMLVDDC